MKLVKMTNRTWCYDYCVFIVFILLSVMECSFSATVNQYLESPCPNIFRYAFDENNELYGSVQVNTPNTNKVQLNLELSVGNNVEGYNGNIQLVQSKEKVVEDIMHQRPILYRVLFPAWTGIPPKITKIFVNGELICSGPKIAVGLVPVLTTINLQHTLRIDVQPLVSSSDSFVPPRPPPSNINFIPSEDGPDGRMGGNPKRPNIGNRFDFNPIPPGGPKPPRSDPPPPSSTGPDGRMGNPKRSSFGNDGFDFDPIPHGRSKPPRSDPPLPPSAGGVINNVDFNPQLPNDPSQIYPGNPFFSSSPAANSPGRNDLFDNGQDIMPDGRVSSNWKRPVIGSNRFDFNPLPPKRSNPPRPNPPSSSNQGVINNIGFSPQLPKDPLTIYPGNPFFSNLPSLNDPGRKDLYGNEQGSFKFFDNSQQPERTTAPTKPTTQRAVVTTRRTAVPNIVKTTPISKDIDLISKGGTSSGRPYDDICGQSVTTNSLVVNGTTVPRGAYPWLVALFGVKPTGLNYMCSASLISDRHVVTAAHCVRTETRKLRPQDLLVILGKLNIQKWVPVNGEKMIEPESIHIHPDYDTMSSDADIAILILSETVQFTKYIRPLCLWEGDMDLSKVVEQQGTVVGWGKDENGDVMTAEPKQTALPIVSQEQCLRSSYQFQYITSNRTFCAGFRNGSGPCNGDSGSGFLLKQNGRYVLRGVVSMSISETHARTCDLSNYVVFTDASKFLDWLLSFIK